jgi:alcohol dehydrogenase (cytochrome c)
VTRYRPVAITAVLTSVVLSGALAWRLHAQSIASPTYTAAQATAGRTVYTESCEACHGQNLDDGRFAAPLKGEDFRRQWGGKTIDSLFTLISTRMPPASPGSLGDVKHAQVVAFLLQQNGVTAGARELPSAPDALAAMLFPGAPPGPGGGLSAGVTLPRRTRPNPLDKLTPVSDEMLIKPPDGEWLNWRRTYDAQGYSPLKQITKNNVSDLRVAWTWTLPNGPNEGTPLVHDGVIFVHGFGDRVQALDAATGDLLWQYSRRLPRGSGPTWKRNIAIAGNRVYVPTSDTHLVALDIKTGNVVWDKAVADNTKGYGMTGGPLVAMGVVMIGTNGSAPGGNFIVGLDANTGEEKWKWYAIAQPGDPNDSWNGLPVEKRSGGSVWVAGTYDPVRNLALFGPAPTYDTGPLRNLAAGARSNDALYTNSTVALNPETGRLAWHFQHLRNDQWDFDWAFERTIVTLPVNGTQKTLVVTGGKQMIFDGLEADGGKYVFSIDLGLQNAITAIDPKTGAKTINERLVPGDGEAKMVCPHAGGGRSWLPTSYNPSSRVLFVPMVESCMDLTPVGPGERGGLSTGVRWSLRPRPDSDGNYGRLQAINLETKRTVWTQRQRAPQTTGILATAGGVVFAGAYDRVFSAYDESTGRQLWKAKLNDVPNSAPITFTANGKQYVALTVGYGGPQSATFPNLTPEIRNPPNGAATLWVFELPEK